MVNFTKLWRKHPGRGSRPCNFANQCAIRMGVALQLADVNMKTFRGAKCWHGHHPKHILRAQELANWIDRNKRDFGAKNVFKKVQSTDFRGKKGIIFIRDGWGATDHIDLWDGTRMIMKGGSPDYFSKGKEVWFWSLT